MNPMMRPQQNFNSPMQSQMRRPMPGSWGMGMRQPMSADWGGGMMPRQQSYQGPQMQQGDGQSGMGPLMPSADAGSQHSNAAAMAGPGQDQGAMQSQMRQMGGGQGGPGSWGGWGRQIPGGIGMGQRGYGSGPQQNAWGQPMPGGMGMGQRGGYGMPQQQQMDPRMAMMQRLRMNQALGGGGMASGSPGQAAPWAPQQAQQ